MFVKKLMKGYEVHYIQTNRIISLLIDLIILNIFSGSLEISLPVLIYFILI